MSRFLCTNRSYELLEPYEGKLSRTVLRGERGSNASALPDNKISIVKDIYTQNRQPVNYLRNRLSHALSPAIVLAKAIHKKRKAPYPE